MIFFVQLDDFLQALVYYDKEHIPEQCLKTVKQEYLSNLEFHPDHVRTKSYAAAGLCAWTINIVRYYEVRKLKWSSGVTSHWLYQSNCKSCLISPCTLVFILLYLFEICIILKPILKCLFLILK